MSDVAASGGDYMEMAAHTRVTIAGPNGVVRSKFTFGKLYEKIGFNKEVISKGRFSEEFHAILLEFSFSEGRGQPVIGARVYLCKWQTLICYQLNTLYSGCPQEMLQASGVVLELLTGSHAVDKEKVGGRRMPRGDNRSRDRGRRDNREFLHENRTKALDNKYQNGVFKSVRGGGPRTYRPVTKNNVEAPANNRRRSMRRFAGTRSAKKDLLLFTFILLLVYSGIILNFKDGFATSSTDYTLYNNETSH
ncbi:hypothetical protein Tco_1112652 [Tanacetum coccineum]|uniref:Uncharacterized protein n=1 Tax=Tanacetum coccineum TaxID=301880 RepID=A0ABQ5IQ78_9ASTR